MGRWAQAKRRGGRLTGGVGLGPPPAPTINFQDGKIIQGATGENDAGGYCRMYSRDTPEGERTQEYQAAWGVTVDWGEPEFLPKKYLYVTELGNGFAYVGESAESEGYDNRFG